MEVLPPGMKEGTVGYLRSRKNKHACPNRCPATWSNEKKMLFFCFLFVSPPRSPPPFPGVFRCFFCVFLIVFAYVPSFPAFVEK